MHRRSGGGRGGRGGIFDMGGFGDPFAGFGGLGDHGSLISRFFEDDPFDNPFFTRPFESVFGSSMFSGTSMFNAGGGLFGEMPVSGFVENEPQPKRSKGPIIRELSLGEDEEEEEEEKRESKENKSDPKKHSRSSKEPFVEEPDDEIEERKRKRSQFRSDYDRAARTPPQTQTFTFQSSTVTYGSSDGAYYTSSTMRRTGSNGVTVEESKEADTTNGRATHRISRGLHEKGHSLTRKLNSDGRVDSVQTLHNLNEDELADFEESWNGKAKKYLPGWNQDMGVGTSSGSWQALRGYALPSTETSKNEERLRSYGKTRH